MKPDTTAEMKAFLEHPIAQECGLCEFDFFCQELDRLKSEISELRLEIEIAQQAQEASSNG